MPVADLLRRRILPLLAWLAVASVAAWVSWHGASVIAADFAATAARDTLDRWAYASPNPTEPDWQQLQADLQAALAHTPGDAVLHDAMAQLHTARGRAAWADPERRALAFEQARQSQQASLALRPFSGLTWAGLAVSLFVLERPVEQLQFAWRQALRHAPREAMVELVLFDLAFATWDDASADMRGWVMTRWQELPSQRRARIRVLADKHGRASLLD